jgi:hypothetical protein
MYAPAGFDSVVEKSEFCRTFFYFDAVSREKFRDKNYCIQKISTFVPEK